MPYLTSCPSLLDLAFGDNVAIPQLLSQLKLPPMGSSHSRTSLQQRSFCTSLCLPWRHVLIVALTQAWAPNLFRSTPEFAVPYKSLVGLLITHHNVLLSRIRFYSAIYMPQDVVATDLH